MAAIEKVVTLLLRDADDLNVVFGPLVWRPSDGTSAKQWYFVVSVSEKGRGWSANKIDVRDYEEGVEIRQALALAMIQRRPPLVLHDTDDELYCARLCEMLWPGERIAKVRAEIEAERREQSREVGAFRR